MKKQMHRVPAPSADAQAQATSELQEYLEISKRQHGLFPRAALVGIFAGSTAVLFRALLLAADAFRNALISWSYATPIWGWIFPVLFGATGATVAVGVVHRYAPEAGGSGIPHLKAVLHRLRNIVWFRVLIVKMVGGVLAIGSGLMLGREGPSVQMGGAMGDGVARWLNVSIRDRLTLTAAGAGAGLAAAFNAPLSGLVFVLEELQRDFRPAVFGAAFLAAAAADVVARLAAGQLPVFSVPSYPVPPLAALPAFAVLGCVAGLLGILFNRGLLATLSWTSGIKDRFGIAIPIAVGALTGIVAWFLPLGVGGGHALAEAVLSRNIPLVLIPIAFVLRFGLTLASYGTGAAGGIFAPLLVLGALLGLAGGEIAHTVIPAAVPEPAVFAVVGMAAYFTAIVRAPLTGVLLIIELTGNYDQMLPLLVSCFCAYALAEYLKDVPVYESLLERDLLRGGLLTNHEEPIVVEVEVQPGAPFVGREVRSLGLPTGCILVRCYSNNREWVPTANTRLEPHMRITALITPEATNALALLHQGAGSIKKENAT